MTAIAHYWFYNDTLETTISSIIFYDDSAEEVSTKLKNVPRKTIKPTGNRPKLSQNEYSLFSFLFNGWSPKKIAYRNGTSVKTPTP